MTSFSSRAADTPPSTRWRPEARSRWSLFAVVLSLGAGGTACKPRETLAPIEMAAIEPDGRVAEDAERMTWDGVTPTVVQHETGALVVWLREPGAQVGHVRFILPTRASTAMGGTNTLDAAATWVVAETIESELRRRLIAWDADSPSSSAGASKPRGTVTTSHRPGRVEIVVETAAADVPRILVAWGEVVAMRKVQAPLSRAQGRAVAAASPPSLELVAISHAVARLMGEATSTQLATRAELEVLTSAGLEKAWASLLDPRNAVVVVHAPREPETLAEGTAAWSSQWRGKGFGPGRRGDARASPRNRIRTEFSDASRREHLMAVPPLTLRAVEVSEGTRSVSPQAVIARVVPTPTAHERALLRLAQRILQEEMDLRVVFAGERAIVVARLPLSATQPGRSLVEGAARWRNVLESTITPERLDTAARLWIGARWVGASLRGEDATALWSEALDLAANDEEVPHALDAETAAMLAIDVDAWTTFARRWLDPSKGEPGWIGVVAGANERQLALLAEVTPVKR